MLKTTSKKLLEFINEFSKVVGYKINMQKSLFYTLTTKSQKQKLRKHSHYKHIKRIKYLGINLIKKIITKDFPVGLVVKNPPCNAGARSSIPGLGTKILHAAEQRNPCSTTTKPKHSRTCAPQETPAQNNQRKPSGHNEDPMQSKKERERAIQWESLTKTASAR